MVCAIDIGTTYTRFGFTEDKSSLENPEKAGQNLDKIVLGKWTSESGQLVDSTPSVALFDSTMNLVAFGFDAIQRFTGMSPEESKKFLYFENFKVSIWTIFHHAK